MEKAPKAEKVKTIQNKIISHGKKTFEDTLIIFRDALTFIVDVVDREFDALEHLSTKEAVRAVERLIHRTKTNPHPKYDFSLKFYKFPSYFRRSAISKALGIVKSHRSNLKNWEKERDKALAEGKRFKKKPPVLRIDHEAFPVFYKGNTSLAFDGSGEVKRNNKKDLATFPNGKVYHEDLSASYNIGARYFIREFLKSFSEKKRLQWEAKVPSLAARTRQTLSSLISLHHALNTEVLH
jgi:hypothetical protein